MSQQYSKKNQLSSLSQYNSELENIADIAIAQSDAADMIAGQGLSIFTARKRLMSKYTLSAGAANLLIRTSLDFDPADLSVIKSAVTYTVSDAIEKLELISGLMKDVLEDGTDSDVDPSPYIDAYVKLSNLAQKGALELLRIGTEYGKTSININAAPKFDPMQAITPQQAAQILHEMNSVMPNVESQGGAN